MPQTSLKITIRQEINHALDRFAVKYLTPAFADIQKQLNQLATKQQLFPTRTEVKKAFSQVGKILNRHGKILSQHSQQLTDLKTDMSEVKRRLTDP